MTNISGEQDEVWGRLKTEELVAAATAALGLVGVLNRSLVDRQIGKMQKAK